MSERIAAGVLDTSVVIDLPVLASERLPRAMAITAITMAELAAGPHASADAAERARRQDRLQRAESVFDPLPFDIGAARAYGRICAAVMSAGRTPRGRLADLLIAATALAHDLPVVTRDRDGFRGLDELLPIIEI